MHSSTVVVAVLTQQETKTHFSPEDCDVQFYSGTGPGGQHRNKTQNSARITHRPTGLVRQAQARSRAQSVAQALAALETAVQAHEVARLKQAEVHQRRSQMGSGERGDKRRTYRFQEGMVKDHQSGRQARLNRVLNGDFGELWGE